MCSQLNELTLSSPPFERAGYEQPGSFDSRVRSLLKRIPILLTFDETALILYTVASPSLNFNFHQDGDP